MVDFLNVSDLTDRCEELRDLAKELPDDIEIFEHDGKRTSEDDCWADENGEPLPAGWYYWTCIPGCMPESDPIGPYDNEAAAIEAVLEDVGSKLDDEEQEELTKLEALLGDLCGNGGDHQWEGGWYPSVLVAERSFEDYARELAAEIGAIPDDAHWPCTCIDWQKAASELQQDYSSIDYDGTTYWYR